MKTVNIGVLAHVDAGKTSLTERLLYATGVIDRVGSVDRGDTQTDSDELERQRGITIRSAVVSFTVADVKVNLIDTPGHPDFIAEVERALGVLDGVILVLSAVEGVRAQTRLLMRTLIKMGMPTLLFVNKIDRMGARYDDLLESIRAGLTPAVVPMSTVDDIGTPEARAVPRGFTDEGFATELAETLSEHDDAFLARYLDDDVTLAQQDYRVELAHQTRAAQLYPVFFGSALTGEGIDALVDGVLAHLPFTEVRGDDDQLRGTVFKIERGRAGEKVAFVRLRSGILGARTKVAFYRLDRHGSVLELAGRTTVVEVFDHGTRLTVTTARGGEIAKVWGLKEIQIGDQLGTPDRLGERRLFAPPSMETVIRATHPESTPKLHEALQQLADQDPFIDVRRDDEQEIAVSLYGEVQKEVLKATLAGDYGLDVVFEDTRIVCVERLTGTGEWVAEIDPRGTTFFWATVGLRVEPGESNSGIAFRLSVELGSLPLAFHKAIEETVRSTLRQGLYGWEVLDALVTLTRTGYASPISAAGDFRKLTPLVLMRALKRAGTRVLEPVNRFELEVPVDTTSQVLAGLAECGGVPENPTVQAEHCLIEGTIPARTTPDFEHRLPGLSRGEGTLLTRLDSYRPIDGSPPTRRRTDGNPLDGKEYLLHVLGTI
ncbi:MAG: TetM/TetW/TetO/TetS family tetracycline resistance ribosomal protection protein [Kutzneria sp.]|nr:TetM/TetW/TetO/TetS family tetracycline resistance ribosomal protection protein [Kutzneria sp.]